MTIRSDAHLKYLDQTLRKPEWPSDNPAGVDTRDLILTAARELNIDEVAILSRFVTRILVEYRFTTMATMAIAGFLSRLMKGRISYGALNVATDRRNWKLELAEEFADAAVYQEIDAYAQEPSTSTKLDFDRDLTPRMVAGLVLVGQRCNLVELTDDVRHSAG